MAKSIHERVRAALEKKARDEKRAADKVSAVAYRRRERQDAAWDARIDALMNGDEPRNAKELKIVRNAELNGLL